VVFTTEVALGAFIEILKGAEVWCFGEICF
jgi:hypothetical protein